jgi:predicted Zn-dependent peptidase
MSWASHSESVTLTRLPNGVAVVTEQMPHVRSVAVGIWLTAGSRGESPAENGIAHFLEHMLFKGTHNRSAEDIASEVDSIGGHLDAFTSKELVCFSAKVLDEHLPIAFDVLSDLLLNPLFREEDVEKEKGVILEELKMEVDNPEYLVHELFSANFWKGHSLGKPILGTKASIRSFHQAMVRDYYRRNYVPSNLVIAAAGNLRHEQMLRLVERYFGNLAPAQDEPARQPAPSYNPALMFKNKSSLAQVQLCLGVPGHPISHEQRYATYILNTILGGGMSSRLFQNIREKRGLAYTVASEQYVYRDSGLLSVYAGTSQASLPELLRLVLQEFRDLKDKPVVETELKRAKDNLKGSFMLSLESTSSRMSHLARQYIYFSRFSSMDEILESVDKVTSADLQTLANEYFQTDRIALTVLGRLNGFKLDREALAC